MKIGLFHTFHPIHTTIGYLSNYMVVAGQGKIRALFWSGKNQEIGPFPWKMPLLCTFIIP